MTHELKNVPELRFPEFKSGWKKDKLGTLIENNTILNQSDGNHGSLYPRNSEFINSGIPYISASNIKNNEIDFSNVKYLEMERAKQFKKGVAQNEDVLLAHNATVGPTALLKTDYPFVILSTTLTLYRLNKDKVNNYYFLYSLQSKNIQNQLTKLMKQTTRNQVPILLQRTMILTYPRDLEEQEKIGNFFSKLDRQIELEERKLELLEQQKKGYMQKIFSQKFRFKDENGNDYPEWEDKLISDIGKVVTGNTPSKKDNDYWNSNQYVWVTPTDISNKKNIYTSGYQLSQKGFSKARQLPKNTLLITCIASIGKNAILRIEGSCNQQINAVIPNDNYDVDYLYYAFEDVSKLMKSIAGKTATQIVNKAVFEKLLLNVPIYEEQQKISGFLNKVDILIDKQTQKIDELKLRKQGFLQKMFI